MHIPVGVRVAQVLEGASAGVRTYDIAEIVETAEMAVGAGRGLNRTGKIKRLELAVREPIQVKVSVRPSVSPGDLSRIVHPPDLGVFGSRVVDRCERAAPKHKAMPPVPGV